jgi:predicted permease
MDVTLSENDYWEKARVQHFYVELRNRISGLLGVQAAGFLSHLPQRSNPPNDGFRIENRAEPQSGEPGINAGYIMVSPGAFEALRVPLLLGRRFDGRDAASAPPVAIIDQTAAGRYFPGLNPIGRRIRYYSADSVWLTIVGVVETLRYLPPRIDARPNVYVPHAQLPRFASYAGRAMTLLVRSTGTSDVDLASTVRQIVRETDPLVPVTRISALDDVVSRANGSARFATGLVALFGAVALGVGALGVYGLLSYMVQMRTNEIGLRLALGADPGRLRRHFLAEGAKLALAGISAGAVMALFAGRLLTDLLFRREATDVATMLAWVIVTLGVTSLLASWLPARRALRVDPLTALRS